ncbi:MAG: glycosyltransferase, partial [Verrucomicrobiota bacterium]
MNWFSGLLIVTMPVNMMIKLPEPKPYSGTPREARAWPVLEIIGDGPMRPMVEKLAGHRDDIVFRGQLQHKEVMECFATATITVVPSVSVETFGRATIESYAMKVPVVASDIGSIAENVIDSETGWLVSPGDPKQLAVQIDQCLADTEATARAGQTAYKFFLKNFSEDKNYQQLLKIYRSVLRSETVASCADTDKEESKKNVSVSPASSAPSIWPRKVSLFGLNLSVANYRQAVGSVKRA